MESKDTSSTVAEPSTMRLMKGLHAVASMETPKCSNMGMSDHEYGPQEAHLILRIMWGRRDRSSLRAVQQIAMVSSESYLGRLS